MTAHYMVLVGASSHTLMKRKKDALFKMGGIESNRMNCLHSKQTKNRLNK